MWSDRGHNRLEYRCTPRAATSGKPARGCPFGGETPRWRNPSHESEGPGASAEQSWSPRWMGTHYSEVRDRVAGVWVAVSSVVLAAGPADEEVAGVKTQGLMRQE